MRNEICKVTYAKAEKTGYGRFKISVSIRNNDFEERTFSHTTTNTEGIDEAMSFEGMERYQALYELIEYSIQGQVQELGKIIS